MAYQATPIRLDSETRATLEGWVRASKSEQRMVRRARIVLLAADGVASRAIAREVGVMPGIVSIWRTRFAASGIDALDDKPRPGAKRVYTEDTDKRILAMLDKPVPKGRGRWDGKLLAEALGDVDINYVRRFLRKHKIDLAGRKSRVARAMIRNSRPKLRMWSVFTCRVPRTLSFCVLTKNRRSRRLNVHKAI